MKTIAIVLLLFSFNLQAAELECVNNGDNHSLLNTENKMPIGKFFYNPQEKQYNFFGFVAKNDCELALQNASELVVCAWDGQNYRPHSVINGRPTYQPQFTSLAECNALVQDIGNDPKKLRELTEQPHHYIFFIHGIGGNANSFGSMPSTIVKDLEKRQPKYKVQTHIFSYKTENPKLTTDDFAMQFEAEMSDLLPKQLKKEDKISLVVHSQGGLVATIWYYQASLMQKGFTSQHYAEKVENVVTLGTPFWGSKMSSLYLKHPNWVDTIEFFTSKNILESLGERQLREMALGSATITRFRENTVGLFRNEYELMSHLTGRLRLLNIVGIANFARLLEDRTEGKSIWLKKFRPFVFGHWHYESDMAVNIPSGNFDSIYYLEGDSSGSGVHYNQGFETELSDLFMVPTIHASPKAEEFFDMAYLPKNCGLDNYCGHPTYEYVVSYLLGSDVSGMHPFMRDKDHEIAGYQVQFRLNFPSGTDLQEKKAYFERCRSFQEGAEYNQRSEGVSIVFDAPGEILAKARNEVQRSDETALTYNVTGFIKYMSEEEVGDDIHKFRQNQHARKNGKVLSLYVRVPGFPDKKIDIVVKPTMTTYVELDFND